MPVSQSILILIYLDKQLFNCKLLSRKLKIRRSPLLDVIVNCIYLSVCTEQQSPVMCDQRSVQGFVVRILLCILSTWYKGTEIQNHNEAQLILQARYHAYTNIVCQNFCDVCQYMYFLIRNICCHKQSLTLSIIYHKHWITKHHLYQSA